MVETADEVSVPLLVKGTGVDGRVAMVTGEVTLLVSSGDCVIDREDEITETILEVVAFTGGTDILARSARRRDKEKIASTRCRCLGK